MAPRLITDAVVCAYNEAARIAPVIRALLDARCLRRVLVVDDGSTDNTAGVARAAGATVLSLKPNRGKGQAMRAGWQACKGAGAIAFFDADLTGLRPDHVCALVEAVAHDGYAMACGLVDYENDLANEFSKGSLNLAGQRVVRRQILERMPPRWWEGYGVEVALNETAERLGAPVLLQILDGLGAYTQRQKVGDRTGIARTWSILKTSLETMNRIRREPW